MQIAFTAAIAFLQEPGRCYNGWLHLAIAQSFTFVDLHFAVACALKPTQFVILLCKSNHKSSITNSKLNSQSNGWMNVYIPLIKWISDGSVSHTSSPFCCALVLIMCEQAINKIISIDETAVSRWSPPNHDNCWMFCNSFIICKHFNPLSTTRN